MLWNTSRPSKGPYLLIALRCIKCTISFTKVSRSYIDCQHREHAGDHLLPFAYWAISVLNKECNLRPENSLCSWNIRPPPLLQPGLSRYSEAFIRPRQSTQLKTHSASTVDILSSFDKFVVECNYQKEDPRLHRPNIEFIFQLLNTCEIEYCLYSAAMML